MAGILRDQGDLPIRGNPAGEDLLHCSFSSLRIWRASPCPEEKSTRSSKGFLHGTDPDRNRQGAVQDAINRYFPITPGFFGASKSKNNETYRRWGSRAAATTKDARGFPPRVIDCRKGFRIVFTKI